MDLEAKYSREYVEKATALTTSRIQYMRDRDIVIPTLVETGSGYKRKKMYLYTDQDIENFKLAGRLDRLLTSHGLRRAIEWAKLEEVAGLIGDD